MPTVDELLRAHLTLPARTNLSDQVAVILKRFVLAEGLEAGERLPPERSLAETLNVSRTVLREAISRLLGEGVLTRQSPRVLVVAEFDRARAASELAPINEAEMHFNDLVELRVFLELGAIETIAQRATPEQLQVVQQAVLEGEQRQTQGEAVHAADAHFHRALLLATGNRIVELYLPLIDEQLRSLLYFDPQQLAVPSGADYERVVHEHRAIFEALVARDGARARELLASHLGHYFTRRAQRAPIVSLDRT
jgi:GntR family transcriptional repressor for pyruvate dehydrogenase complex